MEGGVRRITGRHRAVDSVVMAVDSSGRRAVDGG